jgi:hypothetical protein
VDGDEVHADAGVFLDDVEQFVRDQRIHLPLGGQVVHRHGADHDRALLEDDPADLVEVAAGGQVHDRVGPVLHGDLELLELLLLELAQLRGADVGVDLGPQTLPDADGPETAVPVVRDDHLTAGHPLPDDLGIQVFVFGDLPHLQRDLALSSHGQLRSHINTLRVRHLSPRARDGQRFSVSFALAGGRSRIPDFRLFLLQFGTAATGGRLSASPSSSSPSSPRRPGPTGPTGQTGQTGPIRPTGPPLLLLFAFSLLRVHRSRL